MLLNSTNASDLNSTPKMDILLSSSLKNPNLLTKFHIPRFQQRLAIINEWDVQPGEHVLDIGCGQGESCLALALQVGNLGHVTGIDPAQPDYGSPYTMGETQEHIRKSILGPRITFQCTDTRSFLASLDKQPSTVIDSAVLCHSLWYFHDDKAAHSLFATLADFKIARIYLAEYSYSSSQENQGPHVLAAKAQASFHACKTPCEPGLREQNVRAGLNQRSILKAVEDAGFAVAREGYLTPGEDLLEGHFEVDYVLGELFQQRLKEENLRDDQEAEIQALIQQLRSETERLRSMGISTMGSMDVWWAVLMLQR
ncbi:hypothetical protein N7463_006193 [Penicillium fimorum]|uniref:Methyltransferase domain-containing protein n=1 Tax=Penicillium fimorum TaxID=1882269 RepID=A0A9W9XU13_9EURO|nr:hypothetical protein N7463_006193 [Penicillium fimorum]